VHIVSVRDVRQWWLVLSVGEAGPETQEKAAALPVADTAPVGDKILATNSILFDSLRPSKSEIERALAKHQQESFIWDIRTGKMVDAIDCEQRSSPMEPHHSVEFEPSPGNHQGFKVLVTYIPPPLSSAQPQQAVTADAIRPNLGTQ
jgi:hypothetical protein